MTDKMTLFCPLITAPFKHTEHWENWEDISFLDFVYLDIPVTDQQEKQQKAENLLIMSSPSLCFYLLYPSIFGQNLLTYKVQLKHCLPCAMFLDFSSSPFELVLFHSPPTSFVEFSLYSTYCTNQFILDATVTYFYPLYAISNMTEGTTWLPHLCMTLALRTVPHIYILSSQHDVELIEREKYLSLKVVFPSLHFSVKQGKCT